MKKKGFTLVELLATIAILAVLISLSIVVYNRVKENVLNKELENTISYIEAQARNYANDTNITLVSVEDLILEGYVEPDDETDIYNPVTNESLNCYIVKSTYEDGKYTSTLDLEKNNRDNNGKCSTYEKESNLIIGVSLDNENYETADNNKWYKDNVYLVGMQRNNDNKYEQIIDESKYEIEWKSNYGTTKATAKISTDVVDGVAIKIPYTLLVNWEANEELIKAEASATINIDKEDPKIERIEVPNSSEWSKEKSINIEATDGNGSGLKGIYVNLVEDIEECIDEFKVCNEEIETCIENLKSCKTNGRYKEVNNETKIEFTEINQSGTYQVVAIDNVGNVSDISEEFEVKNVDGTIDNISLIPNKTALTNENITLTGKAQDDGSGLIAFKFNQTGNPEDGSWNGIPLTNDEINKTQTVSTNGTYYFCVKDKLENTECTSYEVKNIDKKMPELTITKNTTSYTTSLTLTGYAIDKEDSNNAASGIKRYQITPSSTKPTSGWTKVNSNTFEITTSKTVSDNKVFYLWVEDNVGNVTSKSINISNQIIVLTSTSSTTLYSEDSSVISKTVTISDIISFDKAVILSGGGTVSGYKSGNSVVITVKNGNKNTAQRYETFTENPKSYYAYEENYCTNYYCPNGGTPTSHGYCTGSNYNLYGWNSFICQSSGIWKFDDYSDQYCDDHYYKNDKNACPAEPSTKCTSSIAGTSARVDCRATCEWLGDYKATCTYYQTDYYCNYGDKLSGRYCYTCTRGSFNRYGMCEYQSLVSYTYYQYTVQIYYYKIKK